MEEALRKKAKELLTSGEVQVVIGYAWNRRKTFTTPVFITKPEVAEKLVFNDRCVNNLALYLTRKYKDVAALGKPAIVAKGCDIRTIAVLISEGQIERDGVHIIGMTCSGVVHRQEGSNGGLTDENASPKCATCDVRNPHITDTVIGDKTDHKPVAESESAFYKKIDEINDMGLKERWDYWMNHFTRCIKCYACRQYCPLCYCERCITEKNMPQWIETSAHPRGNLSWNLIRAQHLAGRCTFCGECDRACPVDIPLNLVNQRLAVEMKDAFDYKSGYDPEEHPPMIVFNPEDEDNFIK